MTIKSFQKGLAQTHGRMSAIKLSNCAAEPSVVLTMAGAVADEDGHVRPPPDQGKHAVAAG